MFDEIAVKVRNPSSALPSPPAPSPTSGRGEETDGFAVSIVGGKQTARADTIRPYLPGVIAPHRRHCGLDHNNAARYYGLLNEGEMILNFCCKETKKIWEGEGSRRFSRELQEIVRRKLRMLHNARTVEDLRVPPSHHLERLSGDRKNKWSIRVNAQFRLCFFYEEGDATEVELVDYHK